MSVVVKVNSVNINANIDWRSFQVRSILNNQVDIAVFQILNPTTKGVSVAFDDDVEVYDGSTKIFGGKALKVKSIAVSGAADERVTVSCVDHGYEADRILFSGTFENETIADILSSVVSSSAGAAGFTTNNAVSTFVVEKIVFNQVTLSTIIKRLAEIVQFDWYWDVDKDLHFFSKEINTAPFGLTDSNGNYVYKSMVRNSDGSQVVSLVKVRGGEFDANTFTDTITVSGNVSKSFKLPYKMTNLTIELDTGGGFVAQDVGIDFEDEFPTVDVLHNFADQSFNFAAALADGDLIRFTGNPRVRVLAAAEDPISKAQYGVIEKLIRDDGIKSNAVARQRASAELFAFASEVIDAKFNTYTSGLRTGMLINAQSTKRTFDDNLLIKTITFKMTDPNNFRYFVGCVSTKRMEFIDLLRKIIAVEPLDIDETEVAEAIFLDTQSVNIVEEIEVVNPVTADEEIGSIDENYILDPLGAGVAPEWVLGPYPNLLARYRLDDDLPNTVIADSGINAMNGVLTNIGNTEDNSVTGKVLKAINFIRASDSYAFIADPNGLTNFDQPDSYSVLFWFKTSTNQTQSMSEHWENFGSYPWAFRGPYAGGGAIEFKIYDGTFNPFVSDFSIDYANGAWHLVVGVRNVATGKILFYIDGAFIGDAVDTTTGSLLANSNGFVIGNRNTGGGEGFDGDIDDFRIYKRALTAAEILTIFNNPPADMGQLNDKRPGRLGISMEVY